MSKSEILYKDVAPGSDDSAFVTTNGAQGFANVEKLPFGVGAPGPVISLEKNYWKLDGAFTHHEHQPVSFWSSTMSGADGTFESPPVITVTFDQQFSSLGITLKFDTAAGDYCSSVSIQWYQGGTEKASAQYTPDSTSYFCEQKVTSYNKVVITLHTTNKPYRYAKLEQILFGLHRKFDMTELRDVAITNESSLISSELPISTMKWTLDSRADVDFMFQLKQPVEVRNDGSLIGVYYIDGYSRSAQSIYSIDCYDAWGVLDESPFAGGIYTDYSASALLSNIINGDFPLTIEVEDVSLTGIIQPCTRREAAQQVLFAWGVCASTDGRDGIRVFSLNNTAAEIGRNRTFVGVSVDTAAIVTEVRLSAHTYAQDSNGSIEIDGVKYSDTETIFTVTNPNVTASDKQNVIEVKDATLVSPTIGQAAAQRLYDYYSRRNTNKSRFVWKGGHLGDCATQPNNWGSTNTGHLAKMEIKLSNTVVASCEAIGT